MKNIYSIQAATGRIKFQILLVFLFSTFLYKSLIHSQTTVNFNYTGAVQTWTVPVGVTSVSLDVYGAAGANAADRLPSNAAGGLGGNAKGTLAVTPGQILNIYVGGAGTTAGVGGFNGGADGGLSSAGSGCSGGKAGGGAGASDVRTGAGTLADRVIVGGGGGGAGRDYCNGSCQPCGCGGGGGGAGGLTGVNGIPANNCGFGFGGSGINFGEGGSQASGGSGGPSDSSTSPGAGTGGNPGAGGTVGNGGKGADNSFDVAGGGGGGGYYGGGGGGGAHLGSGVAGGGAGGGSSYIGGVTNGTTNTGVQSGNGLVSITYCDKPTITCPANITKSADPGLCSATYNFPTTLLLQYQPSGPMVSGIPLPPTYTSTSITASSLSQVGFETIWGNNNIWPVGRNTSSPTVPAGIYITFDVTVPGGTELESLKYDKGSYHGNGPTKASIRSSLDGFTADIATLTLSPSPGTQNLNFNLSSLPSVSDLITFRIYFYAAAIDLTDWSDLLGAGFGNGLRLYGYNIAAAVDCDGSIPSISYTNLSTDGNYNVGTTTITATATGSNGNTASCSFTVTINDTEKPVITCPANIVDNAIPGTCGKVIFYNVTATDNCPGVSTMLTSGYGSSQIFPVGTNTEVWKATDASGNSATCSFTVTIIDNQKPIITGCPSNQTKNTDPGVCTTNATWIAPTASDNCPGVSMTANFPPGSTFSKGVTTVIYTATDASANTQTCTFTITVNDIEKPNINGCPGNLSANMDPGQCYATVSWTAPTATDNCMVSSFTTNKNPGSTFNVGTTTVTYTATDMSGNTKTCTFTVTVTDNQLPTLTCPPNSMRIFPEATCKYTVNGAEFNATATDNCGIAPPLTYTYSGPTAGSGNTSLNGVMFNKGLYSITWKATDVNGNMNTCSFTVDVKDLEKPKITCPPDKMVTTLPGQCSVPQSSVVLGTPTTSDNCGVASTSNNAPASYPVGMTNVIWTVTDVNGNTATCTQKVTVVPYTCGVPTQVLHTDTTATTAKIKWKEGKCATSYELRLRQEITPGVWGAWSAWTTFSGPAGPPQWTHQFIGLNPNKFYNSQVRSVCGATLGTPINDWWWTLPAFGNGIEERISKKDNSSDLNFENPLNLTFIPNPAGEFTNVMIEGFEKNEKTVTMFDLYGKLVFSIKIESNQNQLELDLQTLGVHTGIYLIRVSDEHKQKTEQLMIEK